MLPLLRTINNNDDYVLEEVPAKEGKTKPKVKESGTPQEKSQEKSIDGTQS